MQLCDCTVKCDNNVYGYGIENQNVNNLAIAALPFLKTEHPFACVDFSGYIVLLLAFFFAVALLPLCLPLFVKQWAIGALLPLA